MQSLLLSSADTSAGNSDLKASQTLNMKAAAQGLQVRSGLCFSRLPADAAPREAWSRISPVQPSTRALCPVARSTEAASESPVEEYNRQMQRQMVWDERDPYKYYPERGMYLHELYPSLLCGSQPMSREDIRMLADLLGSRGSILSLQQDKDLAHWGVDLQDLKSEAQERDLNYLRRPAVDFDPHSLRRTLPGAVRAIHEEISAGRRIYVHCTAGLGRAPAACIAYLYWFHDFQLADAYQHVTAIRPCGPRYDAIRAATYDLLDGRGWDAFDGLPPISYSELNEHDKANLRARLSSC